MRERKRDCAMRGIIYAVWGVLAVTLLLAEGAHAGTATIAAGNGQAGVVGEPISVDIDLTSLALGGIAGVDGLTLNFGATDPGLEIGAFTPGPLLADWIDVTNRPPFPDYAWSYVNNVMFANDITSTGNLGTLQVWADASGQYSLAFDITTPGVATEVAGGGETFTLTTVPGTISGPGYKTWVGPNVGPWDEASFWDPSGEPTEMSQVEIDAGSAEITIGFLEDREYVADSITTRAQNGGGVELESQIGSVGPRLNIPNGITNLGGRLVLDNLEIETSQVTNHGNLINAGATAVFYGDLDGSGVTQLMAGATVSAAHVRQRALSIGDGGTLTVRPDGTAAGTSVVETLTIAGGPIPTGTLDLADNNLIINYTDGASPFDDLVALIEHGYNNVDTDDPPDGYPNLWEGTGITSAEARDNSQLTTGLAIIANDDPLSETSPPKVGGLSHLEGVPVDPTSILIKYTWTGDANLDGVINSNDYDLIDTAWMLWSNEGRVPEGGFRYAVGDFNYDGIINSNDYDMIDRAWVLSEGAPCGGGAPLPTPEPATLSLLALGGLALVRRRKQ